MKPILGIILSSIRWVAVAVSGIIAGWIWLELHWDNKVEASEKRVIEKVELMREADMAVIKSIKEDTTLLKEHILNRGK